MKLLPSLSVFGGALALGSPSLWAQPASTPASFASTTASAEWTQGFEAAEGYVMGQSPAGSHVSILGGSATIISGGAAEGAQFLRFTPTGNDNALVLNLPPEVSGGGDRIIQFKVRLTDPSQNSRLVLSYGATVALRLVSGGMEIEAGTTGPRKISVALPLNGWLEISLHENVSVGTWDLLVANQAVLSGLPLQDASALLSDLLIFADGSLDLDAVHVARLDGGKAKSAPSASSTAILKAVRASRGPEWAQRRAETLAQALNRARAGELAGIESLVEATNDAEPDTAEWHLGNAQLLAMLAFALRDSGLHQQAAELGRLALQPLQQARTLAAKAGPTSQRATCEFVAAQINEQLLGDEAEAGRLFHRAVEFEPKHLGAQGGEQRIARQRDAAARDHTLVGNGGGK